MRVGFLWGPGRQRASPEGFLKVQLCLGPGGRQCYQEGWAVWGTRGAKVQRSQRAGTSLEGRAAQLGVVWEASLEGG